MGRRGRNREAVRQAAPTWRRGSHQRSAAASSPRALPSTPVAELVDAPTFSLREWGAPTITDGENAQTMIATWDNGTASDGGSVKTRLFVRHDGDANCYDAVLYNQTVRGLDNGLRRVEFDPHQALHIGSAKAEALHGSATADRSSQRMLLQAFFFAGLKTVEQFRDAAVPDVALYFATPDERQRVEVAEKYAPWPNIATPATVETDTHGKAQKATWQFADAQHAAFTVSSSPLNEKMEAAPGHNKFDEWGNWIGADTPHPHIRFTEGACATLQAAQAVAIVRLYRAGEYGTGEAGFAIYGEGDSRVWVVDDAVRSPEGQPPTRDPKTSPGPLTVLLPEED